LRKNAGACARCRSNACADGALRSRQDTYYELVHTDKEGVMHQPDMLVGGALRQYQMQGLKWLVSL
jgi:hypothetical protein